MLSQCHPFAPMAAPHPNPLPVNGARGRAPREVAGTERWRHIPFAPLAGRRWRQPDEGLASAIYWTDAVASDF
ncbi:hypothetical protein EFQ99_32430 [Rhizobium vallis]|uniref:Uncharacterized protein n=1 Tax=Rhizobium vallis TaxID=634290 RepID=A0A3S0SLF9_9HYPH|nr:hypothetical protein EFQ99_32430 [Rhizobium vallis]